MGLLSGIGNFVGNVVKGVGSTVGLDVSSFENDEQRQWQSKENQLNRDWQEQMLQKQQDYQTEMWNKTNEYNSASAQKQRYQEAGLNPYLMMTGGASAGVASSQGAPSAPSGSSTGSGMASPQKGDIASFMNALTNKRSADADIRSKNADATIKEIESMTAEARFLAMLDSMRKDNKYKDIVNQYQGQIFDASIRRQNQEIQNLTEQERSLKITNALQSKELENYDAVFRLKVAQMAADIDLTKANAKETLSRDILNQANTDKVKLDKNTAERMADDLVNEAKNRAIRSGEPQNIWQGMTDAYKGFNNFVDYMIVKPSKRALKDTKRAFGIR